MAVREARMRFTTERYEQMVERGVLTEDDRVELIDGEILEMAPSTPAHAEVTRGSTGSYPAPSEHARTSGCKIPSDSRRVPNPSRTSPSSWRGRTASVTPPRTTPSF